MRQCLMYRGVIPILADPELTNSVELLQYAINYAKRQGMIAAGDRLVVSKCPRKNLFPNMEEAGVVQLVLVE